MKHGSTFFTGVTHFIYGYHEDFQSPNFSIDDILRNIKNVESIVDIMKLCVANLFQRSFMFPPSDSFILSIMNQKNLRHEIIA